MQGQLFRATLLAGALLATTYPASAYDCSEARYKDAYARMDMAFKNGLLRADKGSVVFISEVLWGRLNFQQKQLFADDLVCAVAGARKGLTGMTFKSDMTGKIIAEWSMGTLTVK